MLNWFHLPLFLWTCVLVTLNQSSQCISQYVYDLGSCHYTDVVNPNSEQENSTDIYLLSLLPYPQPNDGSNAKVFQPAWDGGPGVLPAAELAVQHINEDPNTLSGYTVKLVNADSGCNITSRAVMSFIQHILDDRTRTKKRPIVGVIGPTCSEATIAIASVAGRGGLALPIVHIASSAELENREKYPNTFGVLGSTFQLIIALFSLIDYNHLDKIAILHEDSVTSSKTNRKLLDLIYSKLSLNDGYIIFDSGVYETFFPIDSLQKSGAKIIAITTSLMLAQKIMCIGSFRGMFFPEYQWIIVGHSYEEFIQNVSKFHYNGNMYNCNWTESVNGKSILDRQLFMHFRLYERNSALSLISNRTLQELMQEYFCNLNVTNQNSACPFTVAPNIWALMIYDTVWALALALNMSAAVVSSDANPFNEVIENFQHVTFNGASGFIRFDNATRFVNRFVDVNQVIDSEITLAGYVYQREVLFNNLTLQEKADYRYETVNPILAAVFMLIETVLLITTVYVHIITVMKRKQSSVKASSRVLNQFVFLGCYTLSVVAIVYILIMKTLPLPNYIVGNACHAFLVWLVPIAITLSFGVLVAKTWRIYRIFVHFRDPGPLISNKALVVMVLIQLSIDIAIGTAWTIVSPITLKNVTEKSYPHERGYIILPRQCVFTNTAYWMIILGLYKFLQIFSLFLLSLLARSIRNRQFNTISTSVTSYLGLLLITTLFPLFIFLWYTNAAVHADFVVLCVFFIGNGLVFLVFVLVPPVYPSILQKCSFKFTLL